MALFKSKKQRELEAEIQFRQGKSKIQRFIQQAKKVQKKYWSLGKEALRLGDNEQFNHLASAFLRARDQVNRWERYLLQLETLGVRRSEVAATGEFMRSIGAMSNSILRGASPEEVARMQGQMQKALMKSEALEEVLSVAMESSADAIFGDEGLDEEKLSEISSAMASEATSDEGAGADARISSGLKQIEEAMRKEMK